MYKLSLNSKGESKSIAKIVGGKKQNAGNLKLLDGKSGDRIFSEFFSGLVAESGRIRGEGMSIKGEARHFLHLVILRLSLLSPSGILPRSIFLLLMKTAHVKHLKKNKLRSFPLSLST